jgi:hypothetical protein
MDGPAGLAVPDHGGLALVGDAEGGQVPGLDLGLGQGQPDDLDRGPPDFVRVVLDPARLRIDLPELLIRLAPDFALPVEDYHPRAGGPLVNGKNIVAHGHSPFLTCRR